MLKNRIQEDMKSAMRSKAHARLGTIRLLLAAIKQKEIDERITLEEADILAVINKMIKQRKDSITEFQKGNRPELAAKETQEIAVLTEYLPAQMNDKEIDTLVEEAIKATGAKAAKEMGAVMAIIRPKAQGRADMSVVSAKVKEKLK